MSMTQLNSPLFWPGHCLAYQFNGGYILTAAGTLDAATEKHACMGKIILEGNAMGKDFSTGSAKIHWRSNTVNWTAGPTTVRVGLQGYSNSSGPPAQPDGTFTIYKDLVQGTDSLASNTNYSTTLDAGTNQTLNTGDEVAIVFDMTAYASPSSVSMMAFTTTGQQVYVGDSTTSLYTTAWATQYYHPFAWLETDDGTIGKIVSMGLPGAATSKIVYNTGSANDEHGLVFQVPFRCEVRGIRALISSGNNAAADYSVCLYSDPLGTPVLEASSTGYGERDNNNVNGKVGLYQFGGAVTLLPNTDYCMSLRALGASNVGQIYIEAPGDHYKKLINGGTTIIGARRDAGTGAFNVAGIPTYIFMMEAMITAVDLGDGMGNASLNIGI